MLLSVRSRVKRWYDRIPKKDSRIKLILGIVLFNTSLMLIPSTILALNNSDSAWPFVIPLLIGFAASVHLVLRYSLPNDMRPADGLMMMFSVWILLFAFGTLPYLISGFSLVDSIFESISGFTTTGATIITDVESQPHSLLLWRAITNWIGGIIIVMMFMFFIPMVVSGGRGLLKNEMSGSGGGNLTMKLGNAARQFMIMYIILTAAFAIILVMYDDVSVLDSVTIAMSSISIGGFLNTNDSLAGYSLAVKVTVAIFMLISASNFYLHYRAMFKGDIRGYGRSEEFKTMIVWFAAIILLVTVQCIASGTWANLTGTDDSKFVNIVFTIISVGTTSGFSTVNYTDHWVFLDLSLFIILMIVGGSAGSTSGGVKISRVIITLKALFNEIRQEVHPNAVYTVRFDKRGVTPDVVHSSMVILTIFLVVIGIGAAILNICEDLNMDNAVYLSVAMVTNTGTGSGQWFSGFEALPIWAKLFSCVLMFLGRMEILAILAIFTPGFWLEFVGRAGINKTRETFTISGRIRAHRRNRYSQSDELPLDMDVDAGPHEMPVDIPDDNERD